MTVTMVDSARLRTPKELGAFRQRVHVVQNTIQNKIRVCTGTGCRAQGSLQVVAELRQSIEKLGLASEIQVVPTGCRGLCELGPLVTFAPERLVYCGVGADDVAQIVQRTISRGEVVDDLIYLDSQTGLPIVCDREWPFYAQQVRRVLALNGEIDPTRIEDYIAQQGYQALSEAVCQMSPQAVIEAVSDSGLRGRGGAGFPTGFKWELCRRSPGEEKYVICNADEGDPGAFMDRSILEGNPHSVIEGMVIGGYAIGARQGYVYIRNEYPLAVQNLKTALGQAREHGLLGPDILSSGFDFDLEIRVGSGAFVCGEETALMASIEGRIGEPRPRPPYPAESGLWGKPTNINNVKTWANVPLIILNGADWFSEIGTEGSKGTMIFSLVGKVRNTGLVEVPMGIRLKDLIFGIGGGIPEGKEFKAAQIGGPSGGCLPREHLDVTVDYESLASLGAIMGSGGLVVCDEDTCMVDLARYFLKFTQEESCGKCVPCRLGTRAMLDTLERICAGEGRDGDLEYLLELSEYIKSSSLCGLGQTAPNPVLTTLRYFREEYEAHVLDHVCPAKVCTGLITYKIMGDLCTGCMVCLRNCPSGAISGEKGKVHHIDPEVCTRCGVCKALCNFDAVMVV
jgi:NADH:ubiquinone oxidoreductase subunit F (NADH-binding)/(2Fe-2S) ferredoxin/NAD-dependent dihydropyrimidine dehydrogenase PreA subunit